MSPAVANAKNNFGHDPDELVVIAAYADEGPTLKRWRPRARGRVNRIRKRTCHIAIKVSPALPGEIKPRSERPVRAPRQAPPVEPEAVEETTPAAEPEVEETPAAAETPAPEAVEEPEVEAAEEPEADPEAEAAEEPEAESEPAEEPAADDEPAADEETPKPDEEAKS